MVLPITFAGLGTWQVYRHQWKQDLLDRVAQRIEHEPMPLATPTREEVENELEYTRVVTHGSFDHSAEILMVPKLWDGEPGAHVLTPLVRDDGSRVLVNRGFVPRELMPQDSRRDSLVDGRVAVAGILRATERPNSFTPDNKPESGTWYWRDIDALVETLDVLPFVVEAGAPLPTDEPADDSPIRPGVTVISVPNNHWHYAATWYALALATSVMYLRRPL
ncbi:SurF1 family protein [Thecamonas trahens ATCC 50062]|uniref:SURF1-like protein n=1 Tax=Thecamonas trahens ATCC 50062 TaxID=461836 RepID=A0A0L0DK14_THETB|nr:SurF1 family protein [Thecamonas trahens ATCC 50062]KNC51668.1 SurF1 family protein [Thecamonas trahens ATCC 50062]|eukprot:XP_013755803.1 SurF1 family protein [Thecamonas trahens ATCC 50062]